MRNEDFVDQDRQVFCHNVQQIGPTNKILADLPDLKSALLDVARKHNESGLSYASNFAISDCYIELAVKEHCMHHMSTLIVYSLARSSLTT